MARQKSKKWSDYLWLVSATYFTLGFFNIVFAWLGVICFMIPLFMAVFGGGKGYCNNYCGRGQLFLQIGAWVLALSRSAITSTPYFPVSSTTPSSVFISASGLLMVARARQMKLMISLFSSPRWAACS